MVGRATVKEGWWKGKGRATVKEEEGRWKRKGRATVKEEEGRWKRKGRATVKEGWWRGKGRATARVAPTMTRGGLGGLEALPNHIKGESEEEVFSSSMV